MGQGKGHAKALGQEQGHPGGGVLLQPLLSEANRDLLQPNLELQALPAPTGTTAPGCKTGLSEAWLSGTHGRLPHSSLVAAVLPGPFAL